MNENINGQYSHLHAALLVTVTECVDSVARQMPTYNPLASEVGCAGGSSDLIGWNKLNAQVRPEEIKVL